MNDFNNDILQLKFDGNGINPDKVRPSEICELIIELQNGLNAIIKDAHPDVDTDAVLFTLDSIKKESLGINLKAIAEKILPDVKNTVVASFVAMAGSIKNNDISDLPAAAIITVKKISAFSKKYECNGEFNHDGKTISIITPTSEIKEKKPHIIKSHLKIYGEVIDVGSNIHIKQNDGSIVYVLANKAASKKLGASLWDIVGLNGIAKWDTETFKIIEFKLTEILDYNPKNLPAIFSKIRETDSGWDKFNNNEEINRQLLRD